jgi:hypothetical protein
VRSRTIIYQRTSSKLDEDTKEDWDRLFDLWYEHGVGAPEVVGLGT